MLRPLERVRVVTWSPLDRCPALASLALVGLALATGMAVVGRPPVDLHPPLHRLGVMDPACGLTRGVVAAVRGHLRDAWAYNPASLGAVAAAVAAVGRYVVGRLSGAWLTITIPRSAIVWALTVVAIVALWMNQQHHAALLMRH